MAANRPQRSSLMGRRTSTPLPSSSLMAASMSSHIEVELVMTSIDRRMGGQLCGRQREDRPPLARIHRRNSSTSRRNARTPSASLLKMMARTPLIMISVLGDDDPG